MTMALQRPAAAGPRPAYLDNLFRDISSASPSTHSSTSSISTNSTASCYSLRTAYHSSRPLSPPFEEHNSETLSIRSKKSLNVSPKRFRFGTIFNRRTYPQANEIIDELERRPSTGKPMQRLQYAPLSSAPPTAPTTPPPYASNTVLRRKSLPKLQTSFPPPKCADSYARRPLPAVPSAPRLQRQDSLRPPMKTYESGPESGPQRCYYYATRNCSGYVIGGGPGDPCDNCLVSLTLGMKMRI